MRIDIGEDSAKLTITDRGVTKTKIVDIGDLVRKLSTYKSGASELLPYNTRIFEIRGDEVFIGIEFPPSKKTLDKQGGNQVEGCSLPGGLFCVSLRKIGEGYKEIQSFIFALKGKRIVFGTDKVFKYPMPNIYDDGSICWGGVMIPSLKSLTAVEGILASFFLNRFNNDLFYKSRLGSEYPGPKNSYSEYFDFLSTNDFEDSWLSEASLVIKNISSQIWS